MLNYSLCAIGAAALEEGGRFRVVLSVLEHFILRALRLPSATKFSTRNGAGESRQRFQALTAHRTAALEHIFEQS